MIMFMALICASLKVSYFAVGGFESDSFMYFLTSSGVSSVPVVGELATYSILLSSVRSKGKHFPFGAWPTLESLSS